ncbi:hypothetical protein JTB14_014154 [Gonioctena quinquepunctata]|nr:hypothetical protein JTB14_014154 [Gonioctena quinquepunctata]
MSDSGIGLKRKITSMSKVMAEGNCDVINLDLYRWNMLQRHESSFRIERDLDDLFGFARVNSDSHSWMQRCIVIGNSRVNPPKINEETTLPEPFCHVNQKGGFDGMRQKLWTISNISNGRSVSEEYYNRPE